MKYCVLEYFRHVMQMVYGPFDNYDSASDFIDAQKQKRIDENHPYRDAYRHDTLRLYSVEG